MTDKKGNGFSSTLFMVRCVPGGVPSIRGQGNEAQPADALKENYAAAL